MRARFEQIYDTDEWQGGSGPGSFPIHTAGYRRFLEKFIRRHRVQSIVDLGCGDWQFSRLIDWGGARYQGYDIVPSVIERNTREFSSDRVSFHLHDGDFAALPKADLLITKDVLQHWSDETIRRFLPSLTLFKRALITNCVNPSGPTLHSDSEDGGFRYLDLRSPPFNLKAKHAYTFTNSEKRWWRLLEKPEWRKFVLLTRDKDLL